MTALPVMALLPVMVSAPSSTLVAMLKSALKFRAGVKLRPASKALTSASVPLALQTPATAL